MRRLLATVTLLAAVAVVPPVAVAGPSTGSSSGAPRADAISAFGAPSAPTGVRAVGRRGSVVVQWEPVVANPPVTSYIVHGGPGTCPVIVDGEATGAVLPVLTGPLTVTPQVTAVNAYGTSSPGAAAGAVTATAPSRKRYRVAQFLQFSDFHGAIAGSSSRAGAARLATAFGQDRAAVRPTFTVASGDSFGGAPPLSAEFEEVPTVRAMNLMGMDVATFGNHEHDRPLPHLRRMIDLSDFAWVASNYSTLDPLQGRKNGAKPFTIVTRDGVSVGFVGMNTEDTPGVVAPGNLSFGRDGRRSLTISAAARPVQRQVDAARKAGADIVVALLHQGWDENTDGQADGRLIEVAHQLRGVDLVYGGHTHQEYDSVINGASVVQVPNSGQEYSRTQVCLDTRTSTVVGSFAEFVPAASIASVAPDPAAAALVQGYQELLAARLDVRVGTVDSVFPRGGTPPVERSGQTPLGDLAADAVRERYDTQLVILNGGGIRDTMPAAGYTPSDTTLRRPGGPGPYDVTLGDVSAAFPFGNNAVTSTMTGEQVWGALENGVSRYPTDGRFPQVSGLAFSFDPRLPVGSRLQSVRLADGTPIPRDGTTYTVATVDFMAYGGDGYTGFFNPDQSTMREPFIDAIVARLKRDLAAGRVTVATVPGDRITVLGASAR